MACMVDKGVLDYDEKVSKYWPEFARNGKQNIRVCDVLRHEAGLVNFVREIEPEQLSRKSIKKNEIGKIIEDSTPVYPPDTKRSYHALTRGCILNEIFRRVEPKKRTMGEYLYQEINQKLQADVHIGHDLPEIPNSYDLKSYSLLYTVLQSFVPEFLGSRTEVTPWTILDMIKVHLVLSQQKDKAESEAAQILAPMKEFKYDMIKFPNLFNENWLKTGELPSGNSHCSARGMAKLAACILNEGKLDGVQLMSKVHDKA